MTAIYETAYPRIKSTISPKELTSIYTPTVEELQFVRKHTRQLIPKLGLTIMLKTFQRLGYFLPLRDIPLEIIRHIAVRIGIKNFGKIYSYDNSAARYRHFVLVREFVGVNAYGEPTRQIMESSMNRAALTKDNPADLINIVIEEIVRQKHELPAFGTLLKAAKKSRAAANQKYYRRIYDVLSSEAKERIIMYTEI